MDGGTYLKLISFGDEYFIGKDTIPELVAKKLDYHFINCAESETTNSKIHRNIVDFIIDNNNYKDYIFLIGWTDPYKLDAEYEEEYFTYEPARRDYPDMLMNKLHKFDNYLFDKILTSQRFAAIVYGVQQMLENLDINYYMINTTVPVEYNTYTEKVIKNLNHKYYIDLINASKTMKGWLDASDYDKFTLEAKQEYATYLVRKMAGCGVIERPK